MAHSVWNSFFDDSNEDVSQMSPGFARPGTGSREDSMGFPLEEDRRPSVASATTVSSTGSKSSVSRSGFHKRLQNVFGEDFPADGRQDSETSLNAADGRAAHRGRNNSLNNTIGSYHSRPASPTNSRPRTPQPSSEVTPWEFQEVKVSDPSSFTWHVVCTFMFLTIDRTLLPHPIPEGVRQNIKWVRPGRAPTSCM